MIKGVNKQVLEINETENGFFEKAIFFVKPEYSGLSEGKLKESARKELERAGHPPKQKLFDNGGKLKTFASLAAALVLGAIIGIILSSSF